MQWGGIQTKLNQISLLVCNGQFLPYSLYLCALKALKEGGFTWDVTGGSIYRTSSVGFYLHFMTANYL